MSVVQHRVCHVLVFLSLLSSAAGGTSIRGFGRASNIASEDDDVPPPPPLEDPPPLDEADFFDDRLSHKLSSSAAGPRGLSLLPLPVAAAGLIAVPLVRQTLSTGLQRVIKHDFCQRVIKHNYGSSLKQLINRGGSGGRSSKKTSAMASSPSASSPSVDEIDELAAEATADAATAASASEDVDAIEEMGDEGFAAEAYQATFVGTEEEQEEEVVVVAPEPEPEEEPPQEKAVVKEEASVAEEVVEVQEAAAEAQVAAADAAATKKPRSKSGASSKKAKSKKAKKAEKDASADPSPPAPPPPAPAPPPAPPPPPPPPPPLTPLQEFCGALSALQEAASASAFPAACRLLARYCLNAAETPPTPKHRRIRLGNAVFQRVLGGDLEGSAKQCLSHVGFVEGVDPDTGNALLVMGTAESDLLTAAGGAALERARLYEAWPAALRAALPACCAALEDAPKTLEALTSELGAPHIGELLAHADNTKRVSSQLGEAAAAARLLDQLVELRKNLTEAASGRGGSGRAGASVGPHRVERIKDPEAWYDALLGAKGLVVVDFGAEWCGPCQHVKPLFEELSKDPAYSDVTFLSIDADENPVVCGDNSISSFPTFKFFRNSAEEDLPVVGADISEVEAKIKELM